MEDFRDLQIDGSVIRAVSFIPARSLEFSVLRAPQSDTEKQITIQYALRFEQIRSCRFSFRADPWAEIKSHAVVTASEYLADYEKSQNSRSKLWARDAKLTHFQLVFDEGQIDIIAEEFRSTIEEEMPHVGRFESDV